MFFSRSTALEVSLAPFCFPPRRAPRAQRLAATGNRNWPSPRFPGECQDCFWDPPPVLTAWRHFPQIKGKGRMRTFFVDSEAPEGGSARSSWPGQWRSAVELRSWQLPKGSPQAQAAGQGPRSCDLSKADLTSALP